VSTGECSLVGNVKIGRLLAAEEAIFGGVKNMSADCRGNVAPLSAMSTAGVHRLAADRSVATTQQSFNTFFTGKAPPWPYETLANLLSASDAR
jgi:hypothetical protein